MSRVKTVLAAALIWFSACAADQLDKCNADHGAIFVGQVRFWRTETNLRSSGPVLLHQVWDPITCAAFYRVAVHPTGAEHPEVRRTVRQPVFDVPLTPAAARSSFDFEVIAEDAAGHALARGIQRISLTVAGR